MTTTQGWDLPRAAAAGSAERPRDLRVLPGGPDRMNEGAESSSDAALRDELAKDVDGSFELLVRRFQDRLFTFALRVTGSREDAEEVAQDAFVRAYRALKTYPAERIAAMALKAWLYQVTLNVARNRLRRKRHPTVPLEGDGRRDKPRSHDPADDPRHRPDARLERKRARADIASLVGRLPDRFRAPLILRYVEGLKLEEVAAILNQPLGTTKSNVHRAINALRESMTQSRRAGARA
jgi:RNA polymerase sigma-70 factor (ECF subfamily)